MPTQRPNPVRRPHSKSRTGCRVCKSRRVKCDETRPSCQRCLTHGARCDFLEAATATPQSHQDAGSRDVPPIPQLTPLSVASTPEAAQYPTIWFSVFELELFHHFITSTSVTLSYDPIVRNFWRVSVPQLGFSHPFLLKAVLSVAALHLARLKPQQSDSLVEQAILHHTAASSVALPLIPNASGENFPAIFHFSMLMTIITFARPRAPDNFLLVSDGIVPDWLLVSRGVRTLLRSKGEAVLSIASLDTLFYAGLKLTSRWEHENEEHEALQDLENNIRSRSPPQHVPDLCNGILSLKRCFNLFFTSGFTDEDRKRSALMWLVVAPDPFIELLKCHDDGALCVLAFFCVLLKRLEHLWWIEGWAFHLIERIYSTLDETYRILIRWPMEETGWVP